MFSYENYLPFSTFNESSIFFKAAEVFRFGFLLDDYEDGQLYMQLYSYHNYYVEIVYGDNYEEIKSINAITVSDALEKYMDPIDFQQAYSDLFRDIVN
jgi:hypothetical protein